MIAVALARTWLVGVIVLCGLAYMLRRPYRVQVGARTGSGLSVSKLAKVAN